MTDGKNVRSFKIWEYSVSHSQLLIRSRTEEEEFGFNNIDLIFGGVSGIYAPETTQRVLLDISDVVYNNFVATEADIDQMSDVLALSDKGNGSTLFVVRSGDQAWYVCAGYLRIETNKLGPMQTNLDVHQI